MLLVLGLTIPSTYGDKPIITAQDEVDENDLACAACMAIVDIVNKNMETKSFEGLETRLYIVMEDICSQDNFQSYDYIPPKMVQACNKFINQHEEASLIQIFYKFYSSTKQPSQALLERRVCLELTGDCVSNKRFEVKDKDKKQVTDEKKETTAKLYKNHKANVDDLIKEHGHKMKQPRLVQHNEL